MEAIFTNDNHVHIKLPVHYRTSTFAARDNHEVMFRRISTWLINNRFITKNIIDLGAWIGDNSIPWAMNTNATIYAIDPSPENCNFIQLVCKLNNLSNVKIIQTAISDREEVLTTHQSLDHCSFLLTGDTQVKATSLDILFCDNHIVDVGYVHLDVEGMEFKVIKGMTNIIDTCQPIIAYEQHIEIENTAEIVEYLKDKKYSIYIINEILPGCRHDCRNFLAFPKSYNSDRILECIMSQFGNPTLFAKY